MASPQRPDPNEPQRSYDNEVERQRLARARMNRRAYGSGAAAWWWAFWIVIIALAIWWAGWGWGGSGGWWWGSRGRGVTYGTADTGPAINSGAGNGTNRDAGMGAISGPGLNALTATNKQPYIGKTFQVNSVPVQNRVNNHVFWIGTSNSTPMLVVLAGNSNTTANVNIQQGTRVDITGTMHKAPPRAQAQQQWQLSDDNAARLERQGAYIQATQVHTIQP